MENTTGSMAPPPDTARSQPSPAPTKKALHTSSSPAPTSTPSQPAQPATPSSQTTPPPASNNSSSPRAPANNSSSLPPPHPSHTPPPPQPSSLKHPAKPPPSIAPPASNNDSSLPQGIQQVNLPLVLGVAVGVGLMFVTLIVVIACCVRRRRRKKKPHNSMHYYSDASGQKGSGYYTSGPASDWHNGHQKKDHADNAAPPSSSLAPPGGGWHPPPPPTLMSSDEMSSAAYSGPHGIRRMPPPYPTLAPGFNKSTFTYEELAAATSGFCQANLLGQGGFGYVHKGVLPNEKDIAVKQLKSGSGQGEREFQAEVDIISRVHHRHLVSLVGYCISGAQRMLVYEYVPNKTLEYHLHGKGLPPMDWPTRLKIALGSAKGLAYLHEDCHPRIIHRDIKSANILLDYKFEAMVADFGLAKLSSDHLTHISTRVMGTFGYLAPEYASSGKLTEKSDVFSYGVMLLEMITGKRPVDTHLFLEDSLVDWARPVLSCALADGNYDDLADPRLDGNYDPMEMARMVACAAACVRHSARRRPKMSQIVRALEGDLSLEDLNEGMRPGQSMLFSSGSDYDSSSYSSNMRRIRKVALASPEYSGDYSDPMPDYGRHPSASSDEYSGEFNPVGIQRHKPHPPL